MSWWPTVRIIAAREIRVRGRTRSYRLVTALLVVVAIGGAIAAAVFPSDGDDDVTVEIGVLAAAADRLGGGFGAQAPPGVTVDVTTYPTVEALDAAAGDGDIDIGFDGTALVSDGPVDPLAASVVVAAVQEARVADAADDLGVGPEDLVAALAIRLGERRLDDPADDDAENVRRGVAVAGVVLMFIAIQAYGAFVATSVVEEKTSRVVEVILSHVSARQLLAGKIAGIGVLALLQLSLILAGLVAALVVTDQVDIPGEVWVSVPLTFVLFVLGFTLYALAFAAAGSLVSRQEDAQQVILPVVLPLLVAYFVAFSFIGGDGEGVLPEVLTYVPFTAPIVLPLRNSLGAVEPWEIAVSIALVVVAIGVMLRVAAGIYTYALLRTGARVSVTAALRRAAD